MLPNQNDVLINALKAYYVQLHNPVTSWGNVISMHLSLPGLRGFWPMSSIDETGWASDLSGQGRGLTPVKTVLNGYYGLAPYAQFDGTNYYTRPDENGLDLLGDDAYISPSMQGITVGGWFCIDRTILIAGSDVGLISKGVSGSPLNSNYKLTNPVGTSVHPGFAVYSAGLEYPVTSSALLTTGVWCHIVGRFDNFGNTVDIYLNGIKTSAAAVLTSLYNSTQEFNIGSIGGAASLMSGKASMCFISACAIVDGAIKALYYHTRAMYGV